MEKNEYEELQEQNPAEIQQKDMQEIAKSEEKEQKSSNGRFLLGLWRNLSFIYRLQSL